MLRAILLIVALLIILAIGAVAIGLVDVTQSQQAQAPKIDVRVNDVEVGTTTRQIEMPKVSIDKGGAEPSAQPAPQPTPQGNAQ